MLMDLYRRSAGTDGSAGEKRTGDHPILQKRCFFYMGKEGWKKICNLLELDEETLEQIGKIEEKLANEYGLQAAVITGIEYVLAILQAVSNFNSN